jgi:hypothetical protein
MFRRHVTLLCTPVWIIGKALVLLIDAKES